MPYSQRDLVYLKGPIQMPDGQELPHPVLIISSNRSNRYENGYAGVMMSATRAKDKFSVMRRDEMFESPLQKTNCQFRTYIIPGLNETQVSRFLTWMKTIHFEALIEEIEENIFTRD